MAPKSYTTDERLFFPEPPTDKVRREQARKKSLEQEEKKASAPVTTTKTSAELTVASQLEKAMRDAFETTSLPSD